MITALLLPLLLLGTPADAAVRAERSAGGDDPAIQIWISNNRRFLPGDEAKVQVRVREDGYLLVLHVDPEGHLRVLFPVDPRDDNFARGGRKYEIRGRGNRETFTASDGTGRGTVYAAVSHDPFRFDEFVLGDHWDYRQLAPRGLPAEPEQDLNELVRRMADGSFDYDILTYDVIERVVYASDYSGSTYYDSYGCGSSYFGCGGAYYGSPYGFSVGLFFGRPYYPRHYYDPFYAAYNPYSPFFYDPYYYRPYYYQPYYYRPAYVYPGPGYYGYPYRTYPHGGYYANGYRGWGQPYTPYRFRPADGTYVGYRDRRYDFHRSVNTVDLPPKVASRERGNSSPMRRVTDERVPAGAQSGGQGRSKVPMREAPPRRTAERPATGGGDSRLTRPNIEARRVRAPEERQIAMPDTRDARIQARDRRDLPIEVKPQS